MFNRASLVFFSQLLVAFLLFARNISVARLLSVEDYGIAATFAMLFALIEMASSIGVENVIIQHKSGNRHLFQATIHSMQVARRGVSALVLLALAYPYTLWIGQSDLVHVYQFLALAVLALGFVHMDIYRRQREMDFTRFAIAWTGGPILSLAAVWVAFPIFPDYRIMVVAIIVQHGGTSLLSHLIAPRTYRLGWVRGYAMQSVRFGLPLLLNSLMLFLVLNGDRLIVSNRFDMTTLGWFSAAVSLCLLPTSVLANSLSSLSLPILSKLQKDPTEWDELSSAAIKTSIFVSAVAIVGLAWLGPAVLVLAFGHDFAPALPMFALIAAGMCLRIAKAGGMSAALSRGKTWIPAAVNSVRLVSLPVSWFWLSSGGTIMHMMLILVAAEAMSLVLQIVFLNRSLGLTIGRLVAPVGLFLATVAAVAWVGSRLPPTRDHLLQAHWLYTIPLILTVILGLSVAGSLRLVGRRLSLNSGR